MTDGPAPSGPRLTWLGHLMTLALIGGLVFLGWYVIWGRQKPTPPPAQPTATAPAVVTQPVVATAPARDPMPAGLAAPAAQPPRLPPAQAYQPKDGVVDIDISQYAGYAGLILANGGLAAKPDSALAKAVGLPVRLVVGEGELWDQLNAGRFAASATTVDVLAVLGRQYGAVVPLQLGFSRGADGIVVANGIGSINALKGRIVAVSPWNESEFLLRYLAGEAGIPVQPVADLAAKPAANAIGVAYGEDIDKVADLFAGEVAAGSPRLAGFVGWAPKTEEVVQASGGKARMLATNRNLLVVADVLAVNRGWAQAQPKAVLGLVRATLAGNRAVRSNPAAAAPLLKEAFGWDAAKAQAELARVHFSNLPENLAFFAGTIDSAGSFGGIYQSAVLAYGAAIQDPVDGERFLDLSHLKALDAEGFAAGEAVAIAPIRTGNRQAIEGNPLLSKDIRFQFEPNSSNLDLADQANLRQLAAIKEYLKVSPGSQVLLRGHVDGTRVPEFRQSGGEALVRSMALKAMELSKQRANGVRQVLIEKHGVDPARIETVGRGWEEPQPGVAGEQNRRVEVQWFALE